MMKVLLVGGGGREHALAWALRRSARLGRLDVAPGNAGMVEADRRLDLLVDDVEGIVAHAVRERYDLVVVGPESPLVAGLADRLARAGIAVFGPSARAAELEGSKVFAKRFLSRHRIPTAEFEVFEDATAARDWLTSRERAFPLVVKADGLAAGKGVVIAEDAATAIASADEMLSGRSFGDAGRRIVIEERLVGREVSFFVLSDGSDFAELPTCQDYKRAEDGDLGPNTGGMGAYSPSAFLGTEQRRAIVETIVRPTLDGLARDERPYRGVLYVGLMLTVDGPRVLEYNVRFGDPEAQVLLPRLQDDCLEVMHAVASGSLGRSELRVAPDAAVCVVMAAEGYPGSYDKGAAIEGLERAAALEDVMVFHAGTRRDAAGRIVTSGGRVLGVTALGRDLDAARAMAYQAVERIRWDGERHRRDIARDASLPRPD